MPRAADVGTMFLCGIEINKDGKQVIRRLRNCFLDLEEITDDIDWVRQNTNANIIEVEDEDGDIRHVIIGEDAVGFASSANLKRSMKTGIINPTEPLSSAVLGKMISMVIGSPPQYKGEVLAASIPASSVESQQDSVNHQKIIEKIVNNLGFDFIGVNEAACVIYSNNPYVENTNGEKVWFSSIAFSLGAGCVNVTKTRLGICEQALTFAIGRSGDFIDSRVSEVFGKDSSGQLIVKPSQVSRFKEKYLDLTRSEDSYTEEELNKLGFDRPSKRNRFRKMHFSLSNYYDDLINYIIANFVEKFKSSKIESEEANSIILAGGTALVPGVAERFEKILRERGDFPFDIKEVKRSNDCLNDIAIGALTKAKSEEKKRGIVPQDPPKKSKKEEEIKPDDQPE